MDADATTGTERAAAAARGDCSPSPLAYCTHHASTGFAGYDRVGFSAPPSAELAGQRGNQIGVVRHAGIAESRLAQSFRPAGSVNDMLMISLGNSGRLRGRVDDIRFDRPVRPGAVSYVPARSEALLEFPTATPALVIGVEADLMSRLNAETGGRAPEILIMERDERLSQLAAMLAQEVCRPAFASDLMIDGLLRAIATMLTRQEGAVAGGQAGGRIHLTQAKLKRVVDFVEARLEGEVSLADMARVAGLSPFHFSRVFKLATGETPYHFLGTRRLQRACELLTATDMPLAELALACGFASQSHFTAAFTKAIGTSPGRYRRLRRI